jgi:hypothetical protein
MFEAGWSRRLLVGQAVWAGVWAACTVVGATILRPSPAGHGTHTQLGLPPCPSILLFGRPCLGCGLTTSWTRLLHGDWGGAFAAHPLGPVAYAAFTLSALACLYGFFARVRVDPNAPALNRLLVAFIVVFAAFGAWRFASSSPLRVSERVHVDR